ncbi:FliH/SctL family protein [Faecalispora anaeroviscerum]|uniref:FliH/SctL family protein n=1 Tax=Faecalispora anaeroviscerum TaxID=2991836 RepID=UPI0024BA0020|nr:FliH/SctL family protein [Faecalispora anaeroviscerum]
MSLLPNVIKVTQYTDSRMRAASLSELASSQKHNEAVEVSTVCKNAGQSQEAILQEALEQAKNIMENARSYTMNQLRDSAAQMNEEASRIKAAGFQEGCSRGRTEGFEQGRKEGYARGFEQGLQEGRGAGIRELQEQSDQQHEELARLIEDLEQSKLQILEKFQSGIETLSMQIARKVLHQEISDGIAVPAIVSGVLEEYHDQEWACIHVSPKTAELLQSDSQLMERLQSVSKNLRIVSSASLEDSDCQIDLPDRQLDAGVQTQLKEISYELHL